MFGVSSCDPYVLGVFHWMTLNVHLSCVQMLGRGKGRARRPFRWLQEATDTDERQCDRSPLEQHQSPDQANGDNLQFDLPTAGTTSTISSVSVPTTGHVSSNAAPNNLPLAPFPHTTMPILCPTLWCSGLSWNLHKLSPNYIPHYPHNIIFNKRPPVNQLCWCHSLQNKAEW